MNTLFLEPTDVLFFRDGRPMDGSFSGHGAAWPLPTVTDAALHAALHRAGEAFATEHAYRHRHCQGKQPNQERQRAFGSLTHAGPFPVKNRQHWFFPRPLDLLAADTCPSLLPLVDPLFNRTSSLKQPLRYGVANRLPPSKDHAAKAWLHRTAYEAYLQGSQNALEGENAVNDREIFDAEANVGIGICPETGTQDGERIYSAQYLRLREGWALGVLASSQEKRHGQPDERRDLIPQLFPSDCGQHIIVGGQQRVCSTHRSDLPVPLPLGLTEGFAELPDGKVAVKWVLLTPAIFPCLPADQRPSGQVHPGGWLPNWIDPHSGDVLLQDKPGKGKRQRRSGGSTEAGNPIQARLVAAVTGKPITVTGWALPNDAAQRATGGAKPAQLAVPAGSVYYFCAKNQAAASDLAAVLNWHARQREIPQRISNRRSTLLGEKGFGLGVCASWQPYTAKHT